MLGDQELDRRVALSLDLFPFLSAGKDRAMELDGTDVPRLVNLGDLTPTFAVTLLIRTRRRPNATEEGAPTRDSRSLTLLDGLLRSARKSVISLWDDLTVIGSE